jgi:hypothetical protein
MSSSVCAWCDDSSASGDPRGIAPEATPVSHGMCRPCLERQLVTLRSAPPLRPLRPPLFSPAPLLALG